MTDLQPGSRWLLPVTIDEIDDYAWAKTSVTENAAICIQTNDFPSLIPADRITELEAEVARLRKQMESHMVARSQLDVALDMIERNGVEW